MRKRLEAYTMATELKFVARPQLEMRKKESETNSKNNAERAGRASCQNCLTWHRHRTTFLHLGSAMKAKLKLLE